MRLVAETCFRCDFCERFVQLEESRTGIVNSAAAEVFSNAALVSLSEYARAMHGMNADDPGNVIKRNRLRKGFF
jgi:hypothetical protein